MSFCRVPTPEIEQAQVTPSRMQSRAPTPQPVEEVIEEVEEESIEVNEHIEGHDYVPNIVPALRKLHRLPTQLVNVNSKYWFGTHNNQEYLDEEELRYVCYQNNDIIQYAVMFRETAPTTGHVHFHSIICLRKPKKAHVCIEFDPHASWEKVRGQLKTAYKYISKDNDKYFEFGDPPETIVSYLENEERKQLKRPGPTKSEILWKEMVNKAKAGDQSIRDTQLYARYRMYFDDILAAQHEDIIYSGELKSKNIWIYGPPGTGKTRMVWQMATDLKKRVYVKNANKWWDGYDGQQIVLMDDVAENIKVLSSHIKNWADRYPITAEVKGGTRRVNTSDFHLIITSNYSIRDLFNETDAEAIERRFDILYME